MANDRKRLVRLYDEMDEQTRASLLDYAEFLVQRGSQSATEGGVEKKQPLDHPRPADENVINAIKRLRASYFMLNTDELLNETSALMAQFMIQGRQASSVIDDLEDVFDRHYRDYLEQ